MKYSVILADPPWKFKVYSDKGLGRSAESWYDCMNLEEIKSMPVNSWANDDCVLFLWVTDPFLRKSFEIIDSWGFEYKTVGFVWAKCGESGENIWPIGTGYWTRANPEHCLLATKGKPHRISADVRKLIIAPRREHSRKPDEIYPSIERLCCGPYLELFARQPWPGWDSIGLELETGPGIRRWKSNSGPQGNTPKSSSLSIAEMLKRNLQ